MRRCENHRPHLQLGGLSDRMISVIYPHNFCPMKTIITNRATIISSLVLMFATPFASAQLVNSTNLTDKIYQGDGVINLLKNISGSNLSNYFNQTGGLLLLGADVNENQSGNENKDSLGVAIKQAQLRITTTNGDFSFGDFFTSTTAMLRENGSSTPQQYYTLFGTAGSNTITGSTSSFDLSKFDDVLWLENIAFTGDILSASLRITLLDPPSRNPTASEQFFDFSGGFEEFALLSVADAVILENANLGMGALAPDISFGSTTTVTESLTSKEVIEPAVEESAPIPVVSSPPAAMTTPAAPAPPWTVVLAMAGIVLFRLKRKVHHVSH